MRLLLVEIDTLIEETEFDPLGGDDGALDWVLAIGSPFGFGHGVIADIGGAKGSSLPDRGTAQCVQTAAAFKTRNLVGSLFNTCGAMPDRNAPPFIRTVGREGLSFANPLAVAVLAKHQTVDSGHATQARRKLSVQAVNAAPADSFGADRREGALATCIDAGLSARHAGLKAGRIPGRPDGHATVTAGALQALQALHAPSLPDAQP